MTNRAAALRYARALLEVSQRDADPALVEKELAGFLDLMTSHPALSDALVSPAVPPSRKRGLVGDLLPRLGRVSDITNRLLTMLADRDRFVLLGDIVEAYRERLEELQGVVRAKITTAAPLPRGRDREIARVIEESTGRRVTLETEVDDSLIGGLVAQVGGTVYDGSIAHHLERLRRRFLREA